MTRTVKIIEKLINFSAWQKAQLTDNRT